jgi:DNA-binding transcriptional LysR family regulator
VATELDTRISLHKLEVFCLVVELGGVSKAANHLFVAQPVVTAHLRSLQERLGVKLLYRDGRRMVMTEGGERVYAWANETLSRGREMARDVDGLADGRQGAAVLAASMSLGSYVLPPILKRFREARPNAELTLHVFSPEHAVQSVATGESDFAVIVSDSDSRPESLVAETIGREELVLVTSPDAENIPTSVPIAALETLPLIASPRGSVRQAIVDSELRRYGVTPGNVIMELGHPESMKTVAEEGLGPTLLFRNSVTSEIAAGTLVEIHFEDATPSVPVQLFLRHEKHLTPLQKDLLEEVRQAVTSLLSTDRVSVDVSP